LAWLVKKRKDKPPDPDPNPDDDRDWLTAVGLIAEAVLASITYTHLSGRA
jgi:hypothetical protein